MAAESSQRIRLVEQIYYTVNSTQELANMARMVQCVKLNQELEGLDEPPFDSPLGQKIFENVSKQAWAQWTEHMKLLLNEYRLQPWKPEAQEFIVEQMTAYFF